MRVPLSWLKEFVSLAGSDKEIANVLTIGGLEVENIENVNGESVFEIAITPNRGDWLSIEGLAREISAITNFKFKSLEAPFPKGEGKLDKFLTVMVDPKSGCGRYSARIVNGVKIAPSPVWMQKKLELCGIRPINNVVDATNFVMLELGQPLHAFDYRFINGARIEVRASKNNFKFTTLDEEEHTLDEGDILICDSKGAIALGGVMGGLNSQIKDDTSIIVIESAWFEPWRIRKTSKRLGLSSDSSRRFERGVDPELTLKALNRVISLILETAGGKTTADWFDIRVKEHQKQKIEFLENEIPNLLGLKIDSAELLNIMKRASFDVKKQGSKFIVIPPSFRLDVQGMPDIAEDVARIIGYHNIPSEMPRVSMFAKTRDKNYEVMKPALSALLECGYSECVLLGFCSEEEASFLKADDKFIKVANPLSSAFQVMIPSLVCGLLKVVSYNYCRQLKDIRIFSCQNIFRKISNKIDERMKVGFALTGFRGPYSWSDQRRESDFFTAKEAVESILEALNISSVVFEAEKIPDFLLAGVSAGIIIDDKVIGYVGQITPELAKKFEIDSSVFVCEMDTEFLVKKSLSVLTSRKYTEFGSFPFIERDIAIVVPEDISAQKIDKTIRNACINIVNNIKLFDVYKGKGIGDGFKSLAFTIKYLAKDRTLTDEEVNKAQEDVINILKREFNAVLRG